MAVQTPTQRQAAAKKAAATRKRNAATQTTRLQGAARGAQRALYVPIGAILEARDGFADTVRTYSDSRRVQREFDRFERRGERALRRNRRVVEKRVTEARREVEDRVDDVQTGAVDLVERVRSRV